MRSGSAGGAQDVSIERAEITFRVVERLKGAGPETFILQGLAITLYGGLKASSAPRFVAGDYSSGADVWNVPAFATLDTVASDCEPAPPAVVGARYLVFRDRDGRLLSDTVPIRVQGEKMLARGPVYETVPGDADPWLARVRAAAGSGR